IHFFFTFFNSTPPTEIYTLSLHDALPIYEVLLPDSERLLPGRPDHDPGVCLPDREERVHPSDRRDPGGLRMGLHRHPAAALLRPDRKSTRLNSSHSQISYAVFCLKKKTKK